MSYDYSVLAGTQGHMNHRKTDRLLELAERERLPLVMFAEGGGGRPGDTDTTSVGGLDVPTFRLTAELSGQVPLVAVVSGYCFAGNAALNDDGQIFSCDLTPHGKKRKVYTLREPLQGVITAITPSLKASRRVVVIFDISGYGSGESRVFEARFRWERSHPQPMFG